MTHDTRHVTHGTEGVVNIIPKVLALSSNGLKIGRKRMTNAADILNVSTITTSGCVTFFLTGINLVLQTYRVLS